MRSRSRIASQLYSVGLPVLNVWSSSTMVLRHRRDRRDPRVDRDLDDVGHLERAEQRRERLHLPVGLLDHRAAGEPAVVAGVERELDRMADAHQLQLALYIDAAALERDGVRAKADRKALEHLVVDRLLDARLLLVAQRRDAAAAVDHAQRARVGHQRHRDPLCDLDLGAPARDFDDEVVTRLGGGAALPGQDHERAIARTEGVCARFKTHDQSRYTVCASRPPSTPGGSAPVPWAYSAISASVRVSPPDTNAPLSQARSSVSRSAPASSRALARIFSLALAIAASIPADGLVLNPWPAPNRLSSAGTTLTSSAGTPSSSATSWA